MGRGVVGGSGGAGVQSTIDRNDGSETSLATVPVNNLSKSNSQFLNYESKDLISSNFHLVHNSLLQSKFNITKDKIAETSNIQKQINSSRVIPIKE